MSEQDSQFKSKDLKMKDHFLSTLLDQIDLEIIKGKRTFLLPDFPLKDLISHIKQATFFYFSPPDESYEILSIGIADRFKQKDALHFITHSPQDFLYFFDQFESHFNEEQLSSHLGEWIFFRSKENNFQTQLRVHAKKNSTAIIPGHDLFEVNVWESFLGPWVEYDEEPEHDEWDKMIGEAHRLFEKNKLKKIVLSRKKIFTYSETIEQQTLFNELTEANRETRSYKIMNQFDQTHSFISLTPERLFKIEKNQLETIALAGSTMRGQNNDEDTQLMNELNHSEKLINEHQYVIEDIKNKLSPFSNSTSIGPIQIMKLPYIQHRKCEITSTIKEKTNLFNLLKALHPTAAVGGLPTEEAMIEIARIEKMPRGHYAGPIGILSKNFSEFAVGIRSAFIHDDKLTLFGGAGIVKGSTSEEEWQETGTKMKPFLKVINKSVI